MKYRYRVLALLFLLSMITYVDRVCIGQLGADMRRDLQIPIESWSWVLSIFALSYALFEIPTGAMGDKDGPRKTAARIVTWWSVFTGLTGAVTGFYQLVICRFLFGAGEAGAYPNSSAAISRWFPLAERARATGVVWMAARIGGAVAPFTVLTLSEWLGWRMTFVVFAFLGAAWVVVWYGWFRDNPYDKAGVTKEELAEIGPPRAKAHHMLPWWIALKDSNFWILLVMYHCYCWGSFFYLSWLTDFLRYGRGFDNNDLKIMSWLPFACGACGNLLGGSLSDRLTAKYGLRHGRRWIGAAGLALAGFCMLLARLAGGKFETVALLSLGYACMDAMLPVAWAICLDIGRKYAGAVSGAMNMAGQLASFLSSLLFGQIVAALMKKGIPQVEAYNFPLLPFAIMLIVSAALFTRIDPEKQLVPEEKTTPAPEPVAA
jgi:MFS family permease